MSILSNQDRLRFRSRSLRSHWIEFKYQAKHFQQDLILFAALVACLWGLEWIDQNMLSDHLHRYGATPGRWHHWEGIFLHPFLHSDWDHLIANTSALCVLGPIILLSGRNQFLQVSFWSTFSSGIVIMLLGETGSIHAGASGVVYGYAFFLMASGIFKRTPWTVVLSAFSIATYWHYVNAMFPSELMEQRNISWEGHLGGAIGGIIMAMRRKAL